MLFSNKNMNKRELIKLRINNMNKSLMRLKLKMYNKFRMMNRMRSKKNKSKRMKSHYKIDEIT